MSAISLNQQVSFRSATRTGSTHHDTTLLGIARSSSQSICSLAVARTQAAARETASCNCARMMGGGHQGGTRARVPPKQRCIVASHPRAKTYTRSPSAPAGRLRPCSSKTSRSIPRLHAWISPARTGRAVLCPAKSEHKSVPPVTAGAKYQGVCASEYVWAL